MMIWGVDFEQELRPLIKAFYPGCDFTVQKEEIPQDIDHLDGWRAFLAQRFGKAQKGSQTVEGQPATFLPDYAFYLTGEDGYMAVLTQDGWLLDEFHGIPRSENRRGYKNALMRPFYRLLEQVSQKKLPWGILTGIRPTKQVLEQMEAGTKEEEIARYMREEYFCTDGKIVVSLSVARTEHDILKEMDYGAGYSLYIGIPFCPSTCYYCSFTSYPLSVYGGRVEEYLKALFMEMRYAGRAIPGKQLQTIYIGGGTPTTLSEEQLDRLLTCMEENFDMSFVREVTVEAGRPDSITKGKLSVLRAHGIRRISINPQTMKQATLDLIGRRHSVEEIEEAFYLARALGFDNINMDMILGLAKETPEDVAETLSRIGELSPDNLTVHTLAVKRAARLNTNREEYAGLEACGVQKMLDLSAAFAAAHDYHPYYLYRQKNMTENLENIGYARRGKEGLYNILIMEEKQSILALGAGATTKFVMPGRNDIVRVENVKSLKDYIERIDEMIGRKERFLSEHLMDL